MLGNARPFVHRAEIWVAQPDELSLACVSCDEIVDPSDVAYYTRTRRRDAFDPWCQDCAYQLIQWARVGALSEPLAESAAPVFEMEALIKRGRR